MTIRILAVAALGAVCLTACSDREAAPAAQPATDAATDSAATAPAEAPADPSVAPAPVDSDTTVVPGQTPPTLPTDPTMNSPSTSPPPR